MTAHLFSQIFFGRLLIQFCIYSERGQDRFHAWMYRKVLSIKFGVALHPYFELFFSFFCVRCDDRAKSSGQWLLGSPPSAVVRQLAPRAWYPFQCLLAKTFGVLSPGVGRSAECAQEFAPQSHIHSGQNRQDPVSSEVFLVHSDQYADGRWWFGSSCQVC